MALPQDGQNANGLTKVTQIPAGKELMFIDPTTNEGGIITLEDLTKQILNGLTSQTFGLDSGTQTLPAAINYLYGNTKKMISLPAGKTVTLTSTQAYDTIIIVGQLGGKIFFDIISLHQNDARIIHLGEITIAVNNITKTSAIIEIPNYAIIIAFGSGRLSYL